MRELIKDNVIAPGVVDERSIEDVLPNDLVGYTQHHFFAGVGIWSYSLRQAGWSDDRQVWTASCPCQPFSASGKGKGFDDERHLWPALHWLVQQRGPGIVLGEQVASKDGLAWFDLVQADMENEDYSCGAVDTCAAGFGAPQIRQRLYWMAYSSQIGQEGQCWSGQERNTEHSEVVGLANTDDRRKRNSSRSDKRANQKSQRRDIKLDGPSSSLRMENTSRIRRTQRRDDNRKHDGGLINATVNTRAASPTNGFWKDPAWIFCRDGKWRAVEPSIFPLVNGASERVLRISGYGDGIVAPQAIEFIKAAEQVVRPSDQ